MCVLFLVKLFFLFCGGLILKNTFVVCLHFGRQVQNALKENFTCPDTSAVDNRNTFAEHSQAVESGN